MKKRQQKKIKETEKANADIESPKEGGTDFVEISMPHEELDKLAHKYASLLAQRNNPELRKKTIRRQERLLKKIFKVAGQVLTNDQFQIFISAYAYQIPDTELAHQLGRHQTYITGVLRACVKKIQKRLRVPIDLTEFSKGRRIKDET